MTSSPPPTNGAQDLHENLLYIGDAAFLGYQIKMNLTEVIPGIPSQQYMCSCIQHVWYDAILIRHENWLISDLNH